MVYDLNDKLGKIPVPEEKIEFKPENKSIFDSPKNFFGREIKSMSDFEKTLNDNIFRDTLKSDDKEKFDVVKKQFQETKEDEKLKEELKIKTTEEYGSTLQKINSFFYNLKQKFSEITSSAAKKYCNDKKYHLKKDDLKINFNLLNDKDTLEKYTSFVAKEVSDAIKTSQFDVNPYIASRFKDYSNTLLESFDEELKEFANFKPSYLNTDVVSGYLDYNVSNSLSQYLASDKILGKQGIVDNTVYNKIENKLASEGLEPMKGSYLKFIKLSEKHSSFFEDDYKKAA